MGLLDDHNAFHGAFSERRAQTKEHPVGWAVAGVACSVLWLFGFGSLLGASAGIYVLTGEAPPVARRLAMLAIAIGVAGLTAAVVLAVNVIQR